MTALDLPTAEETLPWITARGEASLARARELAEGLRTGAPTDALETLKIWNDVEIVLANVSSPASLLASVHPDEATRDASEALLIEVEKLSTSLTQDPALYAVLAAVPTEGLDELATRYLGRVLRDFRRAGVDQPDDARARLAEINERITSLGLEFERTIREDVRTVRVTPDRLGGLPADWIEAHPVAEDGLVTITTDYPDAYPVRTYAEDRDLRREMVLAFNNRGYPATESVLVELFTLRQEYAELTGYADWPSYDADVKMIGSGPAIPVFVDRITEAADGPMHRDLAVVLDRIRADLPDEVAVEGHDLTYYQELLRRERFSVDANEVRTYFDFAKVRAGLLSVTGRLFGLRYEPVTVAVWHEDVAAYDVRTAADDVLLGRIYLDLHPREGKFKHAAQFTLVDGVRDTQSPEGVLVCNFPRGLMEHSDVTTLFHEFGHLIHHLVGGRSAWARFSGVATEWDFVEAPSQMLEEWAWDAEVLATFASDAAGDPIPAGLVAKMRAGEEFGKGIQARQQMFYAALSYWYHRDAAEGRPLDLTARMIELQGRYGPTAYLPGSHLFASFGHLGGYSSAYYTYMWSLVIAKDLFSAFDPDDLFDTGVAGRYRDLVLGRGGEKDAADLVADFLGRPFSFDAYAQWLAR